MTPKRLNLVFVSLFTFLIGNSCWAIDPGANEKYMIELRNIVKKTGIANSAEIDSAVTAFPPPTTDHEFLADEAGMMAFVCTRRDPGYNTQQLIDCFRDTTGNVSSAEIKEKVKDCDTKNTPKQIEDCYSNGYMAIHDQYLIISAKDTEQKISAEKSAVQSCESRLATAENKLEALDARISKSNIAKPQLEQIIKALKTAPSASAGKAQ